MSVLLRSPSLRIESNPLEGGLLAIAKRNENLAGAVPISKVELDNIIKLLKLMSSNEDRLTYLEEEKMPFLFTSAQLTVLLEITPSVKTRLAMIMMLGPRLTDPRTKVDYFLGLFRFSEEKEKVQEVLKARTHVLSSSLFRQSGLSLSPVGGFFEAADHSGAKPFIGIKGMAQARERVLKVPVKNRKMSLMPPAPAGILKSSATDKDKLNTNGIANGKDNLADRRANSAPRENLVSPLKTNGLQNGSAHCSSPDLHAQSQPFQMAVPEIVACALESLNTELSDCEEEDSDCNDSHDPFTCRMTSEEVFVEKRTIRNISPMIPLSSKKKDHANGQNGQTAPNGSCPPTPATALVSDLPSTPPTLSPGSSEFGTAGKVKRLIKSLVTRRFSPKYTPLAEGGKLIAVEEKSPPGITKQVKLQADLKQAALESAFQREKRHSNGKSNGNGIANGNGTSNGTSNGYAEKKSTKKSITLPPEVSPPPERRGPMRSNADRQSGSFSIENGTDGGNSKTWRKSTRFVNVKSLAYDFDRMKERGERLQKRRSQTPDRRQRSMRIEVGAIEGIEEEVEVDQPPAEPWYVSDKVSDMKPKRRGTSSSASTWSTSDASMGSNSPMRRKSVTMVMEKSGNCTPGGTPIMVAMSRDLSLYQNMPSEGPIEMDKDGNPLFRYYELVRMNFVKNYDGIKQSDLENYMIDLDFEKHFGMSKIDFRTQPLWRKVQKKKALLLF